MLMLSTSFKKSLNTVMQNRDNPVYEIGCTDSFAEHSN